MSQTTAPPHTSNGDSAEPNAYCHSRSAESQSPETSAHAENSVEALLVQGGPEFETPAAELISAFESDAEAKRWAVNFAMSEPRLVQWNAIGQSQIDSLSAEKQEVLNRRNRLDTQLASEPEKIREAVQKDEYEGIGIAPILLSRTRYYIGLGIACSLAVAGYVLNTEFNFATAAAMASKWGFAQSVAGARGLVFAATFGSFLSLSGWSAVEKYPVHWSVLLVGRVGAVLSVAASSIVTVALGSTFLAKGSYFGWPMLMIPLGSGTLICGAFLAKELAIWIGRLAFPMHSVDNVKIPEIEAQMVVVEARWQDLLRRETRAQQLLNRVEAVAGEFEGRVRAKWLKVKAYESKLQENQARRRQQKMADAEAELSEQELKETDQPY